MSARKLTGRPFSYLPSARTETAHCRAFRAGPDVHPHDTPGNTHFSPRSRRYWFTYQSGLYNADDTPKPAAQAYAMPLVATPTGTNPDGTTAVSIWGQLRSRANNAPPTQVQLQFRPQGSTDWTNTRPPIGVTDPLGFYQGQVSIPFAGVAEPCGRV
jgi:hypothetical protein